MEARRRGATLIHVDPRFTRTSAMADIHVPIRAGTDIAFLGGIVRWVIENERYFRDYVVHYTNAATLLREDFEDTEDLDGVFSGYDHTESLSDGAPAPSGGKYDPKTWQYVGFDAIPASGHKEAFDQLGAGRPGKPLSHVQNEQRDPTLQHPRCVFQVVRRHFQRYTPEMVERVCGIPRDLFLKVCRALADNSGRERTSAMAYAVGWTQHSIGVQYIRTASILQLLLGNIGRPGGGILALRGHASIQGSTDIPTLFNLLPGYLPMPHAGHAQDLGVYVDSNRSPGGTWYGFPKYVVSLLKAWFGEHATADNQYCFAYLPHLTGDHSHMKTVSEMADGKVKGYLVMGENPVIGSVNGALQREGLRQLEWLVVRDLQLTETAEFWHRGPEFERGELRPRDIDTEVFFFPAAAHTEKDGSFTNTQRLLQWHHKAVEPPGDCRSDLWFVYHLGKRLQALYERSHHPRDRPIQHLTWSYGTVGPDEEPDADEVLQEISGYEVETRRPIGSYHELKEDGSTACGCWIYAGCHAEGINLTARRKPWKEQTWVAPEWAWAWPGNRRLLYNRASADPDGKPWSERKRYVWWEASRGRWSGYDEPDFDPNRAPSYRPPHDAEGMDAIAGDAPFIMQADGRGWLFAPSGLMDGPLPTHYEPQESIVRNALYGQQCNPARLEWRRRKDNPYHAAWGDPRFPHVLVTYRLTEQHTGGGMTRWLSWLSELQPEAFCEVSPELAREAGLENGGWATIRTLRGEIEVRVLVTERIPTMKLDGRRFHTIGLPYHWGWTGRSRGESANELISFVGDPNVYIQESKVLTAQIEPGRTSKNRRAATSGPLLPDVDGAVAKPRDLPGFGQARLRGGAPGAPTPEPPLVKPKVRGL